MAQTPIEQLPKSPQDLLLEWPLYRECVLIKNNQGGVIPAVETFNGTLDMYCLKCKSMSVYKVLDRIDRSAAQCLDNHFFARHLMCTREECGLAAWFYFRVHDGKLTKVGQFPSLADLSKPDLQVYRKALPEAKYDDLVKAVGLFAHSIGAGSFVYLRRIFEFLVAEAGAQASATDAQFDSEAFRLARMEDKIKSAASFLPEFLVENRMLYTIMGEAIHDLSEDECLHAFPIVLQGIEMILDERLAAKQKQARLAAAARAINDYNSDRKGKTESKAATTAATADRT